MNSNATTEIRGALVTGGGGFLGRAIVEKLIERGTRVRSYSRGDYPELTALGVECVVGDLSDPAALRRAAQGCDIVFHVAAKAGVWGDDASYHLPNVIGTRIVINACRAAGVHRLVYTSSPSVVFNGYDMEGVDESAPYATQFHAPYPKSKAFAERTILAANGPDLATVALRPHLIWGPRDNHLVPRIIARAKTLRRIGPHDPIVDCTYIDNAADAHVLAADHLAPGSPVAGNAYFISNSEPRGLWDIVNGILAAAKLPPVTRQVSKPVALAAASILETTYRALRLRSEPRLTRFLVEELTTSHWFDISAARRDFGYEPRIKIDQGLELLRAWLAASHDSCAAHPSLPQERDAD